MSETTCTRCAGAPAHQETDGLCAPCAARELAIASARVAREAAGLLERADMLATRAQALLVDVRRPGIERAQASVDAAELTALFRAAYPASRMHGALAMFCYCSDGDARTQLDAALLRAEEAKTDDARRAFVALAGALSSRLLAAEASEEKPRGEDGGGE